MHVLIDWLAELMGWPSQESRTAAQLAAELEKKIGSAVPLSGPELIAKCVPFASASLASALAW
jgi:hypothetical protein